jgi:prophage tail gpP-like protein
MANEAMGTAVIMVGGQRFDRFLSLNLKRSRQEAAGSGTIVLSWPGAEQMSNRTMQAPTLVDGADGQLILDGQLACTFRIDTRLSKGTPKSYELTLQFRGIASDAIDSSPDHPTGQENKKTPPEIMKKLLEGCKTQLIDKSGSSKKIERFIIAEGETIERACRRAAREQSLSFFEDTQGNWILQKAGDNDGGGQALKLGRNFTHWATKRDMGPRFPELGMTGNSIPTDERYGKQAESIFSEEFRKVGPEQARKLRALIDGDHDKDSMKNRGAYEAFRRTQQGLNVTLRMSTWSDDGGKLWDINKQHHVTIPIDQIDDDLTVDQVEFEMTPTTRTATLTLVSDGGVGSAGSWLFDSQGQPIQSPTRPSTPAPPGPSTP